MRVVYLHGFASSPQSSKARFFGQKFREAGILFEAPELDRGNFEELTIGGQLSVIEKAVCGYQGAGKTILMGSSLGGYLAALFASLRPQAVDRLVLMAPAFNFMTRWSARLTAEARAHWKTQGWAPIFHYGTRTQRRLSYRFLEDGASYPPVPAIHQPALLLHGTEDEVVPPEESRRYAEDHPEARLVLFPAGHELTGVMDEMWAEVAAFLEIV